MKKTLLTAALLTAFGVAAVAPQARAATGTSPSGTITFNGSLTASTCVVSVNGGASTSTVTLPTTALVNNTLSAAGASTGWTAFTMALSGCSTTVTGYTTVAPFFSGSGIDTTTGYLTNTGTATNVEVALSNGNNLTNVLKLTGAAGAQNVTAQAYSSNPTFNFYAGYVATTGASTAGSVTATVQYTLNYQ